MNNSRRDRYYLFVFCILAFPPYVRILKENYENSHFFFIYTIFIHNIYSKSYKLIERAYLNLQLQKIKPRRSKETKNQQQKTSNYNYPHTIQKAKEKMLF